VASLPRSTYYFEKSKRNVDLEKNKEICEQITRIFQINKGRYGFRRIQAALQNDGIRVNHKKIIRLMKKLGLKAINKRQKYHSYKGDVGLIADYVINRNFLAPKPNEKWATDVSQFSCSFGKTYLSPIIDMGAGDVVAWNLSLSPNLNQTKSMLDQAFSKHPDIKGLILHSDQGWQYQHPVYQKLLLDKGIIQSMSRKGNCIDNSIIESFFGTIKNEMFYGHENDFQTFEQFKSALAEYIDYYNNHRIKKKTKWMPPSKYREASMLAS
jgi:transposase InsO family protein